MRVATIAEMVARVTADNSDFFRQMQGVETRAQETATTLNRVEASAATNAAMIAAQREAQAATSAARTARQIEAAFATVSSAAPAAASVASARQNLSVLGALQEEAAEHVGHHSLSIGRLEMALERFSAEALGVNHVVGLLGASMGRFALGSIETAGILAGIAAVVAIWEHLTGAAREAAKEQDKAIESFEKMQKAQHLGPQGETIEALNARVEAARAAAEANQRLIDSATSQGAPLGGAAAANPFGGGAVGTEMAAARAQHNLEEARANQARLNADLRSAQAERDAIIDRSNASADSNYAHQLASLISFNQKDMEERNRGLQLLKAWKAEMELIPTTQVGARSQLAGDITTLQNALFPKSEQHQGEKDAQAEISALISSMEQLHSRGEAYASSLTRLLGIYGDLVGASRRVGETFEDWNTRMGQTRSILAGVVGLTKDMGNVVKDIKLPDVYDEFIKNMNKQREEAAAQPSNQLTGALQTQLKELEAVRSRIAIANAQGGTQVDPSRSQAVIGIQRQMATEAEALRERLSQSGLPATVLASVFADIAKLLHEGGTALTDWQQKLLDIQDAAQNVSDTMSGLSAVAGALGDKGSAQVLGNIANAASSVGAAAAQGFTNPGADLQAGASIITAIKSITDSPLQREQLAAMRENNQRLYEVSLRLQGFQTNAGNSAAAGRAVGAALAGGAGGAISAFELIGTLQNQIDALTPYLKQVGLTWVQFAQIAKDSGFQIFDSAGRIMLGPLQQFAAAMGDAVKALFTFSSSFSDRLSLANLQNALAGRTQQSDVFAAQLRALQQTAPNLLPGQYNTGTVEGQNALRQALQQLVAQIAAGTISADQFGGFTNLQDLLNAINPLVDSLNQMNAATIATTSSLVNVPPTFRYAQALFDASAGDPLGGPDGALGWDTALRPTGAGKGFGGGLPSRPSTSDGQALVHIQVDNVTLAADPNAAPMEEQVDNFLDILRRRALAQFGNANLWSEVQPS